MVKFFKSMKRLKLKITSMILLITLLTLETNYSSIQKVLYQ